MFAKKWEGKVFETHSFGVIFNKIPIYKYGWDNICKEVRGESVWNTVLVIFAKIVIGESFL